MYTTNQKTGGYSLVEVLVAIAILLISLVGPMTIAAKGIQTAYYAREQTTALFLAQEGIEAFNAARNDAVLVAFDSNSLATSWSWVSSVDSACFAGQGCGLDYSTDTPVSGSMADCSSDPENCRLYFDANNNRARYSLDSSDPTKITPYRREIKLTEVAGNKGIEVESTVYWSSQLFGGASQSVVLTSALFSIYE